MAAGADIYGVRGGVVGGGNPMQAACTARSYSGVIPERLPQTMDGGQQRPGRRQPGLPASGSSYTLGRFPTPGVLMRRGARSVLKWFSGLYVVLIIVQVFLAGEGIFGLYNIRHADDCNKAGADCIASSKTLDPHRALGFFLTLPGALLFLIVALVAWLPNKRARIVSIVAPILTFVQMVLPGLGRWGGAFHPLNAILVLALFAWLFQELRRDATGDELRTTGAAVPTG